LSSSIQAIVSFFKGDFVNRYNLSYRQFKVLNHISSCRTPALGGFISTCESCGTAVPLFHSCRDRHCPVCQSSKQAAWAEKQMSNSLPVKYFHIVFTLPDSLNTLLLANQKTCYTMLFKAASEAVLSLSASKKFLGFTPGFTAVLHTWGQTLQYHPHLHVIIPAGGLSPDGHRFILSSDKFFLPVKVLSSVFRGIFVKYLKRQFSLSQGFIRSLYEKPFVINIKRPFDSPSNVIKYLARYTHKVAISDSRIESFDRDTGMVTFSYKDNRDGGRQKSMTLHGLEFMRRFFLHVLPVRFMKIRHYGLLGNHNKLSRLNLCRKLLHTPQRIPAGPVKSVERKCKICGSILETVHCPWTRFSDLLPTGT